MKNEINKCGFLVLLMLERIREISAKYNEVVLGMAGFVEVVTYALADRICY